MVRAEKLVPGTGIRSLHLRDMQPVRTVPHTICSPICTYAAVRRPYAVKPILIVIAVMEQDYHRVVSELPALLKASGAGVFLKRGQTGRGFRPWDKIRPQSCSHLWIDIFVLKKYHSLDEIEKVMGGEIAAKVSDEMTFPLFHYDSRMALSYWPREWLADDELLPTRPMPFAQLMLPLPSRWAFH